MPAPIEGFRIHRDGRVLIFEQAADGGIAVRTDIGIEKRLLMILNEDDMTDLALKAASMADAMRCST